MNRKTYLELNVAGEKHVIEGDDKRVYHYVLTDDEGVVHAMTESHDLAAVYTALFMQVSLNEETVIQESSSPSSTAVLLSALAGAHVHMRQHLLLK